MRSTVLSLHLAALAAAGSQTPLRLRADGSFVIVQIADVHTGEGEDSWGPATDAQTYRGLGGVLDTERPDLAVFTGDMLTGLNVLHNATAYWDALMAVTDKRSVPHTAILGNHDAEPNELSHHSQSEPGALTNRTQLMQHDTALPLSHSHVGPAELLPAVSVYVVDVLEAASERPALQLFHMDSGGGGMEEEILASQITWFNATMAARRQQWGPVPALVFIHIPVRQFADAHTEQPGQCFGDDLDGVTPPATDAGFFAAIEAAPEVLAVFVGHDHCNDFCCRFGDDRDVSLCFGRHSGRGGYNCGGFETGSRVVTVGVDGSGKLGVRTHVRLNNGTVVHEGVLVHESVLV